MKTLLQHTLLGGMLLFSIFVTASDYHTHYGDSTECVDPSVEQRFQISQIQRDGILEKINALAIKLIKKAQSYGKYRENNSIKTHPYTTFAGDWEFREVEKVRNQILMSKVDEGYKRLWKDIYG